MHNVNRVAGAMAGCIIAATCSTLAQVPAPEGSAAAPSPLVVQPTHPGAAGSPTPSRDLAPRSHPAAAHDAALQPARSGGERGYPFDPASAERRLTVGYRLVGYTLTDGSRSAENSYVGGITELDEQQDITWYDGLFADWVPASYGQLDFGGELAFARMRVETRNTDGHTDGDVKAAGPILAAIARTPIALHAGSHNWTLEPTLGLGVAFLGVDFDHEGWWYYGFPYHGDEAASRALYDDWVARGAPMDEINYRRIIELDDSVAPTVLLSARAHTGNLGAELYARYMQADADGVLRQTYTTTTFSTRTDVEFALTHLAYGLGVTWSF